MRGFVDPKDLSYSDSKLRNKGKVDCNYHFTNRLFDRDTLLVLTYDINFLYVLSAYVQSHGISDSVNNFLRKRFRDDIVEAFEKTYDFYRLTPLNGLSNEEFVEKYFRKLIGKIYCTDKNVLILALKKGEEQENRQVLDGIAEDAHWKEYCVDKKP